MLVEGERGDPLKENLLKGKKGTIQNKKRTWEGGGRLQKRKKKRGC